MAIGTAVQTGYIKTGRAFNQEQSVDAGGQVTDPARLAGKIAVQITGNASAISAQVERSSRVSGAANWAPVGAVISGAPSTGIPVEGFHEPGVALWRVRVISITGAAVISIGGEQ